MKERVEKILEELGGGDISVEEVRNIEAGKAERRNLVVVRLKSEDMRRVFMNKWKLKGEEILVKEDLTWEERRIRWKMRRIARKEKVKGKRLKSDTGRSMD